MNDEAIRKQAEEFARANRKKIAEELTDISIYVPDDIPASVFMAGSPGAGKTEYSRNLVKILEEKINHKVIRIDPDELRNRMPGYSGNNSYLFQKAVSIVIEEIHHLVLKKKQTFLLDGTFSKYEKAVENINRSLKKSRQIHIFYVYQKPDVAWAFTQAREKVEGRHIPKEAFIKQFLDSRETIDRIRKEFDDKVVISLVKKNFETHTVSEIIRIFKENNQIDDYIETRYTKDDLEKRL